MFKQVALYLLPSLAMAWSSGPTMDSVAKAAWGNQAGAGVDAVTAHKKTPPRNGCRSVVVAVIDTGVEVTHPDLKGSLWVNQKEARGRPGIDDDLNGFVDDVNGWDFAVNSPKMVDSHGHGTHVAGIIAAKRGGDVGHVGICPGARIMALRYYNEFAPGMENMRNTVAAVEYAIANGAQIINYSGGGAQFSHPEYRALQKAHAKGVLVVAAAGNERSNADVNLYFPAAYPLDNIISVTGSDQNSNKMLFANWGVQRVHVVAPGNSIISTMPTLLYGFMTGTSQATAFVSGIAAYLLADNPKLTHQQLKAIIYGSAVKYPQLKGMAEHPGIVNLPAAVKMSREGKFK